MTGVDGAYGLRVSVLGPLVVTRHGCEVALGTGMRPAVLGLLALHPNTGLHREAIIDALWGNAPPATAVNQVQAQVSRLRKILDPGRPTRDSVSVLESLGASYLLRVTSEQLDLLAFRDLAERARAAQGRGDLAAACGLCDDALGLWHGSPLAELDLLRGHPAVTGLVGQHTALIMEYAQAAFGAGLHDRVLPHLRALTDREPLNEKAHAHLMIALAGSGQQAAALQIFDEMRRRLDDQLGVYPFAELTQAHDRVLRQDLPLAGGDPGGSAASALAVGPDQGPFLGRPFGGRPLVYQLPPALTDFTGRSAEVASLIELLTSAHDGVGVPVAVISGPPGVGKTALALQVAHLIRQAFPDGQLFVELAGSTRLPRDPADVLGELLRALGLPGCAVPDSAAERAALFRSQMAGQAIFMMADDAGSAGQVRALLPGTAGCAVIVTSRSRLGALAGAHLRHLEPLPSGDAVEMLGAIIGHQRVAAEPAASDRLVAACGRLPLAVRIVGAKLATRPAWPVLRIADAVADQRRRLDELTVDDLEFRASVMPSYQALDERARRAFRRLGLLWPGDVAEWVIAALLGEPDACDVVNVLVDKSLLMPAGIDATGEPRYRLHDLLRDYARERLDEESEPERDAALLRALKGWLAIAAAAERRLPRIPGVPRRASPDDGVVVADSWLHRVVADPITWFSVERINLMAATLRACATGLPELAAQLAAHQVAFQFFQARLDDGVQLWRSVIAAAESAGDVAAAAQADLHLVHFLAERAERTEAQSVLQRCMGVFEQLGDQQALALAWHWRAYFAEAQGLRQQAQQDARQGIEVAKRVRDRLSELSSLRVLGLATARLGDHDGGIRACEDALAIARELHESYAEFECLQTLAYANILAGRPAAAIGQSLQGEEIALSLGYRIGEAYALWPLGDAYLATGRYRDTIEAATRAHRIFQDHGIKRGNGICLLNIGLAYQALGQYRQAAEYLEASLPVLSELHCVNEQRARRALQECGQSNGSHPAG